MSSYSYRQAQRGLSLVELMISITIGLLILSAMTTLFVNQTRTRAELDKSNRMTDNGRYALEVLAENLRVAGFYGTYAPSGTPTATQDPCDVSIITNAATNPDVLLHHVQGYNAAAQTSQIASLPSSCSFTYTAGSATSLKAGSDILVLHRASTSSVAAAAAVAATVYLQVSNCSSDLVSYQITTGSGALTTFHNKDCTTSASLRPFIVQAYFVSPDNNAGDGIPTLKRRELDAATGAFVTTPLVEGIEYMQIDYGVDGDSNGDGSIDLAAFDGAADSYSSTCATCVTPADWARYWSHVVSIKINIIARNNETTTGYTDTKSYVLGSAGTFGPFGNAYKRHAYTQVVRLVNPSARLETP
jgi:type IV pilus assembly protein PilW